MPDELTGPELYCDGGVIGVNPSPHGGTYAWCLVENGKRVAEGSGIIRPDDIGVQAVSNNNAELTALLEALRAVPHGWRGRVNSDSQVALGWVFSGWKQDKIPPSLRLRVNVLRQSGKLTGIWVRLLQGHPTKKDLAAGIGSKRSLPVSEHNVWCDEECGRVAKGAAQ